MVIDADPGDEDDFESSCSRMAAFIERSIAEMLKGWRVGEDLVPRHNPDLEIHGDTFKVMLPPPIGYIVIEATISLRGEDHDSGDEDDFSMRVFDRMLA